MTNRPPAPLVLLIFLIFSLVILPVSATTISFIEDSVYSQNYTRTPDTGVSNTRPGYEGMVINKIQDYPYIKQLVFETAAPYTLTDPKKLYASTPFSATMDGNVIGSGFIQYNVNLANNKIIIRYDFNSFDVSGKTGKKWVSFNFNRDALNGLKFVDNKPFVKYIGFDNAPLVFVQFIDGGNAVGTSGDYYIHQKPDFRNDVIFTDINDKVNVEFIRNTNRNHPSTVDIFDTKFLYYSGYGADDFQIASEYPPVTVNVTTVYGKRFSYVYGTSGDPDPDPGDPGDEDPGDPTVTVYVKNSQNGALIANSNIVIDALVNGEYYTVVNKTEPSGIFSITLQPTGGGQPNPDGYRLIATADGYNNPMPEINFTVDDSKKYIYCLLDPIDGGPENENNTFIDFFVRDMSSNPISGATVKFGKYTLITNSQGYTVFEVPKNAEYTYTVSKSGYGHLTGNAVIGSNARHTINTVLAPAVTPTTPTPIPTLTHIKPTPTMTAPTGEPVSNWLEWFAAHFGMILGGGVEIGKIFMWLCFTVPVGVYVGKESKAGAAGFMAGAGIVTLFFVLIGWVPIWLLVLLALIIGLLYAKVFNNSDTGGGR